jgi:triphosphatase
MPVETELKLRIAPKQLGILKRHALLRAHQLARPVTRRLYNIYYDTPKLELQQSGMALRLRRSGKQWLQTLKGGGGVQGGLHRRNEWEMPVSGPALDFSLPQVAEWKDLLPQRMRKKLQPVFVTDFLRNSRMLSWQGAEIELCMDQGEISTEHLRTPICELELELKSGEPRQLFELALAILDIVPFELESVSKAEQGFRLMSGYLEQPVKALPVTLGKQDDLSIAMQRLVWSVLQQVQGNVRGLALNQKTPVRTKHVDGLVQQLTIDNVEYLHQLRVALRRLRVLLRMAASVRADEPLAAFRKEVAALGIILGRIREWDVFIANTVQPMCARMPDDGSLQLLLVVSQQQRDANYNALHNDAQARTLQRLLLRLAIWLNGTYWQQFSQAGLQARAFARTYLSELAGNFAQAGENLSAHDAAQLHSMRIQAKKLRYSAEFFASLYGKHKSRQYLRVLSEVQEVLGQINDDAVANRLLDDLSSAPELAAHQYTTGLARGWIARDRAQQLRVLQDVLLNFQRQCRYWGT